MQGKISICRQGLYKGEDEKLCMSITDEGSGCRVIELDISLEDMMRALTGFSSQECEIQFVFPEKVRNILGKNKECKRIDMLVGKVSKYSKEGEKLIKDMITIELARPEYQGWILWDDGIRTQQNKTGIHSYVICRYV